MNKDNKGMIQAFVSICMKLGFPKRDVKKALKQHYNISATNAELYFPNKKVKQTL